MDQYIFAAYRLQQLAMHDVARELRPRRGDAEPMTAADPAVVGARPPVRVRGRLLRGMPARSRTV